MSLDIKSYCNEELNSLAFMNSPTATLIVDEDGKILNVNNVFSQLTGYTNSDAVGENMSLLKSGKHDYNFYKSFWKNISQLLKHDYEIFNRCKDNTILLMRERVMHINDGVMRYFVVTLEDITEEKKQLDRQCHLAMHDELTGLANRTLLNDRFTQSQLNAVRNGNEMGVLLCDLNEFKQVNDSFGHSVGDSALKEVADKLMQIIRTSDTVCRYGGDEFVIIFGKVKEYGELDTRVKDIKSSFPISIKNQKDCSIDICIGYASFPSEGTTLKQLISMADIKLYEDKKRYYGT